MNSKIKTYKFYHIVIRVLSYFVLLVIPCFIIVLIYSFNIYAILGIIAISIWACFICFWNNRVRIEIYDDKIIYYGLRKHVFEYRQISYLIIEKGIIKLMYNEKVYRIAGFINPLIGWINEEKNKNLVDEINDIRLRTNRK